MKRELQWIAAAIMMLLLPATAVAQTIPATPAHAEFSLENLRLPGGEHMGMLGGSLLFAQNRWLAIGPGFYGAVSGRRGGFITLGLAARASMPLYDRIALELGAYVGAGGGRGGQALTGGGLYLRTHLGIHYDLGRLGRIGIGASHVAAPYGSIHSTQPYLSYQYAFNSWVAGGWRDQAEVRDAYSYLNPSEQELALVYREDVIPSSVRTATGLRQARSLRLMGVAWNRYLDDHRYLHAETDAAMGGQSSGYMQILLGGGYRLHLTDATALKLIGTLYQDEAQIRE